MAAMSSRVVGKMFAVGRCALMTTDPRRGAFYWAGRGGNERGKRGAVPGFRYFVLLICGFWCIIKGINPSLAFRRGCASTERFLYKFESGPHRSLEAALVFEKPKSR